MMLSNKHRNFHQQNLRILCHRFQFECSEIPNAQSITLVEQLLIAAFTPLVARAPAAPAPTLGVVPQFDGVRAHFHAEPEASSTEVSMTKLTPFVDEPDTAANRVKELPRQIALAIALLIVVQGVNTSAADWGPKVSGGWALAYLAPALGLALAWGLLKRASGRRRVKGGQA
jgi:hypothetical protein